MLGKLLQTTCINPVYLQHAPIVMNSGVINATFINTYMVREKKWEGNPVHQTSDWLSSKEPAWHESLFSTSFCTQMEL